MAENLAGKILKEHYYLENRLGASGFGTVYLAKDIFSAIDGRYIVKHFSPSYENETQQEIAISLFKQESNSLQKLGKHPQIPRIYDFFVEDGNFFLVQELIEGETLQQELARTGNFDRDKAIKLLVQTLEVLKFVHQLGHIHRNIKPANLIRNSFDYRIFLINFGALTEKINPQNFERQGAFLPTVGILNPGYTPDEQLHGRPEFCSDLYALGMVVIEAMTGEHPSNLPRNFALKLVWRDRLSPRFVDDPQFCDLIDKMVEQKWQERYQSANAVLADLESISQASNINTFKPEGEIIDKGGELVIMRPVLRKGLPSQAIEQAIVSQAKVESKSQSNKFKILSRWGIFSAIAIPFLLYLNYSQEEKYITYENEYIKVEYPKTWQRENQRDLSHTTIVFVSPPENSSDRFQERVKIAIEEYPQPISLQQYSDRAIFQIEDLNNLILSPPQSTTLSRSDAKYTVYQGTDRYTTVKRKEIWTVDYQQIYRIIYTAEPDKFQKFLPQATKMIESLEILR